MRKSLLILPLLLGAGLKAQENNSKDVFDFTSNYKAKIEEADKINLSPTLVDTIKTEVDLKYSVVPKHMETDYSPKGIPPVKMKVNTPLKKLKHHYVSLGLGMNAYPEFVYGYNMTRDKEHSFSLRAKHFSAERDIAGGNDFSNQNLLLENNLQMSYKRMKSKYTFYGDLDYSYDQYNLYGSPTWNQADINGTPISMGYFNGKANLGYQSSFKDSSKINHQVDLSYINFFNDADNMEHQVVLNGNLKKWLDQDLLRLDVNANYNSAFANVNEVTTFDVVPSIERTKGDWSVELGGGISGNLDPSGGQVMLVPKLNASYQLIDKVLNAFATADGGYDRLSYRDLILNNRFASLQGGLTTVKTGLDFSAGIRGGLTKRTTYKIAYRYVSTTNDFLFVHSQNVDPLQVAPAIGFNPEVLEIVAANLKNNQFNAELSHDGEKWKNVLYGELNSYTSENTREAWHRPLYALKYNTSYSIQDKIAVGADVYYLGGRTVPLINTTDNPVVEELEDIMDLNLHLKYNYNKNLQAFVRLNNVLNQNYMIWDNYPSPGFNFLAGANYKF